MSDQVEFATFGAGCFWGVEARFREVPGVLDVTVGYMGGQQSEPTYREVCTGNTGHVEVVEVKFDPEQVSYQALLELFFNIHNPTTLNRQGADKGSQYRSVIFFHSDQQQQQQLGQQAIADADKSGRWSQPVVTGLEAAMSFWRAEDYHQRYLEKNGLAMCAI